MNVPPSSKVVETRDKRVFFNTDLISEMLAAFDLDKLDMNHINFFEKIGKHKAHKP